MLVAKSCILLLIFYELCKTNLRKISIEVTILKDQFTGFNGNKILFLILLNAFIT
jgi:hypothetical protein